MAESSLGELGAASIAIKTDISAFMRDIKLAQNELKKLEDAAKPPSSAFTQMFNKGKEAASGMKESFIGAKEAVEAFIAVMAVEKIIGFVKSSFEAAQALKDLSEQTGLTTTKIQELQYRGLAFGISTEEMTSGLMFFSKAFGQFLNDQSGPGAKAFTELGVKAGILSGAIRNPAQAFDVLSQHIRELGNANQAAGYASEAFGRQLGVRLAPLLRESAASAAAATAEGHKLGFVLGEDVNEGAAQASIKVKELLALLGKNFDAQIVKLAPEIEDIAKQLTADLPAIKDWVNQWLLWFGAIDTHSLAGLDAKIAETKSNIASLEDQRNKAVAAFASPLAGELAKSGDIGADVGGIFSTASLNAVMGRLSDAHKQLAALNAEREKLLKNQPDKDQHRAAPEPPLHLGASKEEIDAAKKLAEEAVKVANERATLAEKITAYDAAMTTADQKASKDMIAAQDAAAVKSAELSNNKIAQFDAEMKAAKDAAAAETAVIQDENKQQLAALEKLNQEYRKLTAEEHAVKVDHITTDKVTPDYIQAHGQDLPNLSQDRAAIEQGTQDRITAVDVKAQSDQQSLVHDRIEYESQAAYQIRDVWISSINDSFTAFENFVENGGSAMQALTDLAKQVANDIFNTFLRLSIENPLLNMLYGGQPGFNLLPTIGVGGNGYGSGGALGGLANWLGLGSDSSGGLFGAGGALGSGGFFDALLGGTPIGQSTVGISQAFADSNVGTDFASSFDLSGLAADLPQLADGGPVSSGDTYLVGEQGPELFVSDRAGQIVPNGQLGSIGGGDTHVHFHGITDAPSIFRAQSQIEAMVTRAASRGQRGL